MRAVAHTANVTPNFRRGGSCFIALVLVLALLLISVEVLHAGTLSLSVSGAKLDFVWVPVDAPEGVKNVEIGDFGGKHPKEKKRSENIYAPFERDGKRGYYLGRTEVTEDQWAAVMGEGLRTKLPVTGKTYAEVQAFLEKLSTLLRESGDMPSTPDGAAGVLKLPTECEWEYAARGAEGPRYREQDPYGGDLERYEVFFLPGSEGKAREVASRPPNPLGLHDMLGNVKELMQENYSVGGTSGGGLLLKGGSFISERGELRSSARTEDQRSGKDGNPTRRSDAGLRLCISAEIFTSLGSESAVVAQQDSSTTAEDSEDLSVEFYAAYQEFQRAEKLEREGFVQDAAKKVRFVAAQLEQIRARNPSWQPLVVEFRLEKAQEALLRFERATESSELVSPASNANEFIGEDSSSALPQANFTPVNEPSPVEVMLLGDSFSVGGFGDIVQASLLSKYSKNNVAIFASYGSSPEDWLTGDFVTDCGYRQTTPAGKPMLLEYKNGVRPRPVKTPKVRALLGHYRPEIVIVQQGTNWMDALAATDHPDAARYRRIIADFIKELRRGNPEVTIFWVLPPASSKYPPRVHDEVDGWINEASRKMGFYTINSRGITGAYRDGQTGVDGVHYSDAAAAAWARGVLAKLTRALKVLPLGELAGLGVQRVTPVVEGSNVAAGTKAPGNLPAQQNELQTNALPRNADRNRPAPSVPAESTAQPWQPLEIFEQQRILIFPQGYTVHNDDGAVLKIVPGPAELPCVGIARDKAFAPKGAYLSDWSYERTRKGEKPNWVAGEPAGVEPPTPVNRQASSSSSGPGSASPHYLAIETSRSKTTPAGAVPVMVYDAQQHSLVGNSVYNLAILPKVGDVVQCGPFSATFAEGDIALGSTQDTKSIGSDTTPPPPKRQQDQDPGVAPQFVPDMVVMGNPSLFFRLGPRQAGGADVSLRSGEKVMLLRKEFGYSRVQLANGFAGYMANQDIAPAPASSASGAQIAPKPPQGPFYQPGDKFPKEVAGLKLIGRFEVLSIQTSSGPDAWLSTDGSRGEKGGLFRYFRPINRHIREGEKFTFTEANPLTIVKKIFLGHYDVAFPE
jgi:hypothetical protein